MATTTSAKLQNFLTTMEARNNMYPHMKYIQKLTKIGNSAGVIIPSQILEKLGISIGTHLFVEQVQDKLLIAKEDSQGISPEFMKIAESLADRYGEAFEELAKK